MFDNEKLQVIVEKLKNKEAVLISALTYTEEEFLTKDSNGICFFEYLMKFKKRIFDTEKIVFDNVEIARILLKYDRSFYTYKFSEKVLFSDIDGKRLIDILIESNRFNNDMFEVIKNNTEIVDLLIASGNKYSLGYLNLELVEKLMVKKQDGEYLIEKYLIDENIYRYMLPLINDVSKLLEICEKYNNFDFLKYANKNILMSKYKDTNVLLFLVNEKGIIPDILEYIPEDLEFVKFLMDNNLYDYLKDIEKVNVLALNVLPNKTLLDILIEKGYDIKLNDVREKGIVILYKLNKLNLVYTTDDMLLLKPVKEVLKDDTLGEESFLEYMLNINKNFAVRSFCSDSAIAKKLYEMGRLDLLVNMYSEVLFQTIDGDNGYTYFDYVLDAIKEGKLKYNINRIIKGNNKVLFYIIVAKHDMIGYIDSLTVSSLLSKVGDKTLLDALLDTDSELTMNKILTGRVKADPKIAIILKSRGYQQDKVNIFDEENIYTTDYINSVNNKFGMGPLFEEGEVLLKTLESLFLTDGKSDKGLISALVSGYRNALFINYEVNIEEIKRLIEVKKNNMDRFYYLKVEDGSYFSSNEGYVCCENAVANIILHETGHALHYYLASNKVPDNYMEVIEEARNNPEILGKIKEFSEYCFSLHSKIEELVKSRLDTYFEKKYTDDKKDVIRERLGRKKEDKIKEYADLGVPQEQLDIILGDVYSLEEYMASEKRIIIGEQTTAIMDSEYGPVGSISDVIDAIYEGRLFSDKSLFAGHGFSYYYTPSHGFDEMIADFVSMSKSNDAEKYLGKLKEIVGEEVYYMISDFYYRNIVGLNIEEIQTKKVGGK